MAAVFRTRVAVADTQFGGPHATSIGTTSITGTPSNTLIDDCRVVLFSQQSFSPVRQLWSGPGGQWQFRNLRAGRYFVVAFDRTGQYGGECETDIVVPTP
jgi:hypothetical protein